MFGFSISLGGRKRDQQAFKHQRKGTDDVFALSTYLISYRIVFDIRGNRSSLIERDTQCLSQL